jgi:hypoxanthine-DNA glycosylase
METLRGFAPIADENSRILILGSMPSVASLRKGQYYRHPQNAFWRLMPALLGEPYTEDYAQRTAMLLRHGVALWDVLKSCEREGSLDSHIKRPEVNNFAAFFDTHPRIRRVCLNGGAAYALFKKHVGFAYPNLEFTRLGSTSPAHAVTFEQRLNDWQRILPLPG